MTTQEIIEVMEARLVALKDEERGLRDAIAALKQKRRAPTTNARAGYGVKQETIEKVIRVLSDAPDRLTSDEWAEQAGVSPTTIHRIARADTRVITERVNGGPGSGRGQVKVYYEFAARARERAAVENGS